ncbi:MAG: peptidase M23, partial [Gemmatimonadota bacterium]|nr:peptidase M23 [Gemmatimonadota bacterium]
MTGALAACEQVEVLEDSFRDLTPYEAYQASLAAAGLGETALVRDWEDAGQRALTQPVTVTPPFEEEGY